MKDIYTKKLWMVLIVQSVRIIRKDENKKVNLIKLKSSLIILMDNVQMLGLHDIKKMVKKMEKLKELINNDKNYPSSFDLSIQYL